MRYLFLILLALTGKDCLSAGQPFFQASQEKPYHLSMGAVLFDDKGRVACHHFEEIFGYKDIYILMRESMEDGETPLKTLERGLQEEFGASADPLVFLGCLSGPLPYPNICFEKTTLYVACHVMTWNPENRDPNDPEATSSIEWLEPKILISLMQAQGEQFEGRVDADESEIVKRAIPYIEQFLENRF